MSPYCTSEKQKYISWMHLHMEYMSTDKDDIETNTGESIEAESIIPRESARSGATHEWDDIFINKDSISLYYILEAANYTDIFCAFTESYVENMDRQICLWGICDGELVQIILAFGIGVISLEIIKDYGIYLEHML